MKYPKCHPPVGENIWLLGRLDAQPSALERPAATLNHLSSKVLLTTEAQLPNYQPSGTPGTAWYGDRYG